jgi:hypothetical protein
LGKWWIRVLAQRGHSFLGCGLDEAHRPLSPFFDDWHGVDDLFAKYLPSGLHIHKFADGGAFAVRV